MAFHEFDNEFRIKTIQQPLIAQFRAQNLTIQKPDALPQASKGCEVFQRLLGQVPSLAKLTPRLAPLPPNPKTHYKEIQ